MFKKETEREKPADDNHRGRASSRKRARLKVRKRQTARRKARTLGGVTEKIPREKADVSKNSDAVMESKLNCATLEFKKSPTNLATPTRRLRKMARLQSN